MRIVSYGGSYIGRRSNNEDSIGRTIPHDPLVLQDKGRLYLVCDGMGGTKGGEVASHLAVETIMDRYYAREGDGEHCLQEAIREASAAIAARADEDAGLSDMGSTVVALVVFEDRYIHAHVGDSRVYLLRDGRLRQLTRDHLHILDDLGVSEEEAETHPYKNILSRALGYLDASEPECGLLTGRPGDRLLLCSDGLSDSVSRDAIQTALELSTPQDSVELLLDAATANDAHDNSTALVVFLSRDDCIEEPTQRIPLEYLKLMKASHTDTDTPIPVRLNIAGDETWPQAAERK
jgi:protein phosphatase